MNPAQMLSTSWPGRSTGEGERGWKWGHHRGRVGSRSRVRTTSARPRRLQFISRWRV